MSEIAHPSSSEGPVRVFFASQSGTAEEVADDLVAALRRAAIETTAIPLNEVDLTEIAAPLRMLIVSSTTGDGDVPDNGALFWKALEADTAPRLDGVEFGVLALGDRGFATFCGAGRKIDARLEELGATRIVERTDCGFDFEDDAAAWTVSAVATLTGDAAPMVEPGGGDAGGTTDVTPAGAEEPPSWGRTHPFPARLVVNRLLSGAGSDKETRHFELDVAGSGIAFAPGDSVGVVAPNDPTLVEALRGALGQDPDVDVEGTPFAEWLAGREIRTPSPDLIALLAERAPDSELARLRSTGDAEALADWLWGRDILDLLTEHPDVTLSIDDLRSVLLPLQHRDFSVASSPRVDPDRVALTVAVVRHGDDGRVRQGVASTYLADRLELGEPVGVFFRPNNAFRLPEGDQPVIMVGPGTGIAPFRAFLHELAARGTGNPTWLFFGDRRREADFLYREELEQFIRDGVLTRLDTAFSRDRAERVYVQHRMHEHPAELYRWLEQGACLYVCGDASYMAKDVDAALHEIIADQRGLGADDAADYVANLVRSHRYVRDVY